MIVKVQQSISPVQDRILIYNRDRSIMYEQQMPAEKISRLLKGEWKGYFKADLGADRVLRLRKRVPEQDW